MTLYQITKILKTIMSNLPNVEGQVIVGDVYELNARNDMTYPCCVITKQTDIVNQQEMTMTYGFNLFYVDRLTANEDNLLEVQSIASEALEDVVSELEAQGLYIEGYEKNVFKERFNDLCGGAYLNIQIQTYIDECVGDEWRMVRSVNGKTGEVHLSYASKEYVDSAIESAITSGVDLDNYYTKDETDARISEQGNTHIDKLEVGQIDMTTHSSAGTCNINGVNKITASSGDIASLTSNIVDASSVYVQYMGSSKNVASWISQKLDASAYTPTDLSNYYTKSEVDSAIEEATSGSVLNAISGVSFNGSAATVVNNVASITANVGEDNVIETVKVNGSALTVTNKAVDIAMPRFKVNNGILNIITQ